MRDECDGLILCSGIPQIWLEKDQMLAFGPAPTSFGDIKISIKSQGKNILVEWRGQWFTKEPPIDIQLPGFMKARVLLGTNSIELKYEADK